MSNRFSIEFYESPSSSDADLYSIYDSLTMQYTGLFYEDDRKDLLDVCKLLNELDGSFNDKVDELATLQEYIPLDKEVLVRENIRLRGLVKYQESVYRLEKQYFSECLNGLLEEYPDSKVLWDFKSIVDL